MAGGERRKMSVVLFIPRFIPYEAVLRALGDVCGETLEALPDCGVAYNIHTANL